MIFDLGAAGLRRGFTSSFVHTHAYTFYTLMSNETYLYDTMGWSF